MTKNALVLSGGGARAAYQVGALKAISDITQLQKSPFKIVSGLSAGAINGLWLASRTDNFDQVTTSMWRAWSDLTVQQVFKTSLFSLLYTSFRWILDLGFGGLHRRSSANYLLDTSPLCEFLSKNIDFMTLKKNIETGELHAVTISAVNYLSGISTAFFDGHPDLTTWSTQKRIGVRCDIGINHVMASSAIPLFFPPIKVQDAFYGDGMIRMNAPLSPAIHLGCDRILTIGARYHETNSPNIQKQVDFVSIGDIIGTFLNGLFFDSLDNDIERSQAINRSLSIMSEDQLTNNPNHLRPIPILAIRPSKDLGKLACDQFDRFPMVLRYFLRGLGISKEKGWDILSYLSFNKNYVDQLLKLGYDDAMAQKEKILDFFHEK